MDRRVNNGRHKSAAEHKSSWIQRDKDAVAIVGNVTAGAVHPEIPHWRAERERGRTSLSKPGGGKGDFGVCLGSP